jgi:preprotein translocase subunit SecA
MNNQRSVVYGYRNEVLKTEDPHALVLEIIEDAMPKLLGDCFDPDLGRLIPEAVLQVVNTHFPLGLTAEDAASRPAPTTGISTSSSTR